MKRATELLLGFSLVMGLNCEILTTPAISQEIKREAIIEAAKKEGKLQIYALLVVADHMQIIQRFKEKYPFIDVALYRTTSERLYTRIETEARANTHLGDVIGISGFQMYQLVKRGFMAKYESPERRSYEPGFKDKDGYWTAYYVTPSLPHTTPVRLAPTMPPKTIRICWIQSGRANWSWRTRKSNGSPP